MKLISLLALLLLIAGCEKKTIRIYKIMAPVDTVWVSPCPHYPPCHPRCR